MKKIIIIGGGITGLSAAWKLSEKGFKVEVIDVPMYDFAKLREHMIADKIPI